MDFTWLLSKEKILKHQIPPLVKIQKELSAAQFDISHGSQQEADAVYFVWWVLDKYCKSKWSFWEFQYIEPFLKDFDQPYIQITDKLYISYWNYYFWLLNPVLKKDYSIQNDLLAQLKYLKWLYTWGIIASYVPLEDERKRMNALHLLGQNQCPLTFQIEYEVSKLENKEYSEIYVESTCVFYADQSARYELPESYIQNLKNSITIQGYKVNYAVYLAGKVLKLYEPTEDNYSLYQIVIRDYFNNWQCHDSVRYICLSYLYQPEQIKYGPRQKNVVNVLGYPYAEMGLGEDCRTTTLALAQNGIEPRVFSIVSHSALQSQGDKSIERYVSHYVFKGISIVNSTLPIYPQLFQRFGPQFYQDNYVIGIPPWEFNQWPKSLEFCYKFLNEIWAPTKFIYEAHQNQKSVPIHYIPLAVYLPSFEKKSRENFYLPKDKFLFYFMFDFNSSLNRKNPLAVVRAFKSAFEKSNQNVGLVIKTMYSETQSQQWVEFIKELNDDRIILIDKVLSRSEVLSLIECTDSFVSLHRSEGFGRGLAEAMLLNKPVITTGYSGNTDFCLEETSFLVDYNLIPVKKGEYVYAEGFSWAEPLHDSAVAQMREVYQNQKRVGTIVQNAKKNIEENYSLETVGRKYFERLQEIGI